MALVDSKRLAAFRLGYHRRLLRSILWTGIKGQSVKFQEVRGCIRLIDDALLVLSEGHGGPQYSIIAPRLKEAGELHDIVSEIGPSEEHEGERRAIEKLEHKILDRIDFIIGRLVKIDLALTAWDEVGFALAELRHKVAYVYETVPIPDDDWKRLNDAVDRLPPEDRVTVEPFTRHIKYRRLSDLAAQIIEVYGDICYCLSSPDRQADQETESASTNDRVSSTPTMVEDVTGLTHTETYSVCRAKGMTYNLLPPAQVLIHSMNEWKRDGVILVSKDDLLRKAKQLYQHDRQMKGIVDALYERQLSKVFSHSGTWKTLVKQAQGRKGLYYLDL